MLDALPRDVCEQAQTAYDLFRSNPRHPSLHFKRVIASGLSFAFASAVNIALWAWNAKLARFSGSGSDRMKRMRRFSQIADAETSPKLAPSLRYIPPASQEKETLNVQSKGFSP
jgi:hypothetical protein